MAKTSALAGWDQHVVQSDASLDSELSIFALAEEAIMAAAARRMDDEMRRRIRHAFAFQKLCMTVGDIEGVVKADAVVERLIC